MTNAATLALLLFSGLSQYLMVYLPLLQAEFFYRFLAHLVFLDLSGGVHREVVHEFYVAGHFVAGQALDAVLPYLFLCGRSAFLEDYKKALAVEKAAVESVG